MVSSAQESSPRSPSFLSAPLVATQESSTVSNGIVALDLTADPNQKGNLNLPERLKLSPPRTATISLNTHKRFRSEEPEEQVVSNVERDETPTHSVRDPFKTTTASDESDGAPEVASAVSRKPGHRLAQGRKRRRLEGDISRKLESESFDTPPFASVSNKAKFLKPTDSCTTISDAAGPRNDLTGNLFPQEPASQKLVNRVNMEPGVLGSSSNVPGITPTKLDENDIITQGNLALGHSTGSSPPSGDRIPFPFGKDAPLDAVIAEPGFKMPFCAKREVKISQLNADSVNKLNTYVHDDTESGSHTEAGSATLTNNSFITVPENQRPAHGGAYSDVQGQNLTDTATFPLTQQFSPKRLAVRPMRPRKAMPQPVQRATSLQDFKQRLLDRNPRTHVWGPPGLRKTRFVGA